MTSTTIGHGPFFGRGIDSITTNSDPHEGLPHAQGEHLAPATQPGVTHLERLQLVMTMDELPMALARPLVENSSVLEPGPWASTLDTLKHKLEQAAAALPPDEPARKQLERAIRQVTAFDENYKLAMALRNALIGG